MSNNEWMPQAGQVVELCNGKWELVTKAWPDNKDKAFRTENNQLPARMANLLLPTNVNLTLEEAWEAIKTLPEADVVKIDFDLFEDEEDEPKYLVSIPTHYDDWFLCIDPYNHANLGIVHFYNDGSRVTFEVGELSDWDQRGRVIREWLKGIV